MRKGPRTEINTLAVPPHVKAIMRYTRYVHPDILAQYVREKTGIDFSKVTYCTSSEEYIAGELFVAHAYFGIGLTYNEIADYARHSTFWVQLRVNSLTDKLDHPSFIAQLRSIVLHARDRSN